MGEYQLRIIYTVRADWIEKFCTSTKFKADKVRNIGFEKEHASIDNTAYRKLFDISKRAATRDLSNLTERGILIQVGRTGYGTYYKLAGNKG